MNPEFQDISAVANESDAGADDAIATEPDSFAGELAEQKDLNARLAAEFDHFKRRTREESETRAAVLKERFIHELLPAIDNLERALACGAAPGSLPLRQGVEMTLQQLLHLLRQHGIETEEVLGQIFDPSHHEAIAQRHDPSRPDQAVLEVYQRGYWLGDTLFRPAKVVVNNLAHARNSFSHR
jgi:molecular chaperone GrpE